ncbi:Fasciclin domain-containing protein, partial [Staphylotrichum tortipilum]
LNFHARITVPDILASNGIIHAISSPLIPPPDQTTLIRLLPRHFSTLALALERSGVRKELEGVERENGGTFFAPTNGAWERLGPRVNRFLFSDRGARILRALVRYHVVVNTTVYSDGGYGLDGAGKGGRKWHVDLPSLLEGREVGVDVYRWWGGRVAMVVNERVRVVVRDGVARDGVVQVVGRVLIPPREDGEEEEEEISVEELTMRLEPYVEEPKKDEEGKDGRQEGNDDL